jgi:hypothetical protein
LEDYAKAVDQITTIAPQTCRDKAMREYHYLRMARDYAVEYQKEIERNGNQ